MTRRPQTKSTCANALRWTLAASAVACGLCVGLTGCGSHKAANETLKHGGGNDSGPVLSLELSARVVELSGLKTAVASAPTQRRVLQMRGSLALDVNRLVHIHARFPGQMVKLATFEEKVIDSPTAPTVTRTLNFMDHVAKGQKLGEIWSKDLGRKERNGRRPRPPADRPEEPQICRGFAAAGRACLNDRSAKRALVEVGEVAVTRAVRTLRSWSLSEQDIQDVKDEGERIHKGGSRDHLQDETWATVDVISPIDGTIVEKRRRGDVIPPMPTCSRWST